MAQQAKSLAILVYEQMLPILSKTEYKDIESFLDGFRDSPGRATDSYIENQPECSSNARIVAIFWIEDALSS